MKLRFRANTLRLRVNQKEVHQLAAGGILSEAIEFPDNATLCYTLKSDGTVPQAIFSGGYIQIAAPSALVAAWAESEDVGLYFALPTAKTPLKVAIEKDLECVDAPLEENDPNAFPRGFAEKVC